MLIPDLEQINVVEETEQEEVQKSPTIEWNLIEDSGRNGMKSGAPFGYDSKEEAIVVNEKETANIKWIYEMVKRYCDSPPDLLINEIIERSKDNPYYKKELSCEEAKEKVSLDMVKKYVVTELNFRMKYYETNKRKDTLDEFQEFLGKPVDKECIAEIEQQYRSGSENIDYINSPIIM